MSKHEHKTMSLFECTFEGSKNKLNTKKIHLKKKKIPI
jgi:hypothetical protein